MMLEKSEMNKKFPFLQLKRSSIGEIISYVMGIFVTTPILTVRISNIHISIFNILFGIFFIYMLSDFILTRKKVNVGRTTKLYAIWFYLALISSLFGLVYFNGMADWTRSIAGYMPRIIGFLLILIMLTFSKYKTQIAYAFFKGFFIGCLLNIGWAIIEGIVFYSAGYSLSNRLFSDYLSTLSANRQYSSIIRNGSIRVAGFNRDPAHLGGIIPIIIFSTIINKGKIYIILLSIVALVFSQSTTGLASTLLIMILNYKKILPKVSLKKIIKGSFLCVSIILSLYLLSVLTREHLYYQSILSNAQEFSDRVSTVYINTEEKGIRTLYHLYTPLAIMNNNIRTLTGTGFGTASYPFVSSQEISNAIGLARIWPYDPESTYISYLFNLGVIGTVIYLHILFKNYRHYNKIENSKMNNLIFASLCGVIISGLFYHYTLTAYQVLIIIMSTVLMDKKQSKPIEESNNL